VPSAPPPSAHPPPSAAISEDQRFSQPFVSIASPSPLRFVVSIGGCPSPAQFRFSRTGLQNNSPDPCASMPSVVLPSSPPHQRQSAKISGSANHSWPFVSIGGYPSPAQFRTSRTGLQNNPPEPCASMPSVVLPSARPPSAAINEDQRFSQLMVLSLRSVVLHHPLSVCSVVKSSLAAKSAKGTKRHDHRWHRKTPMRSAPLIGPFVFYRERPQRCQRRR
jgi:hypothetical protein